MPEITEAEAGPDFPVPTLDALVQMKLTSFRLKDQVHLMDMLDVGLIDESWSGRLPPELADQARKSSIVAIVKASGLMHGSYTARHDGPTRTVNPQIGNFGDDPPGIRGGAVRVFRPEGWLGSCRIATHRL